MLSGIRLDLGEPREALNAAEEALKIALDLRSHVAEGCWLLALGDAQQELGEHGEALTAYGRSATLHRRLGDRSREAQAWQGTGETYHRMGRGEEAAAFHRRAAAAHRELDDAWSEAVALDGLARALYGQDPGAAGEQWARCLRLLGRYEDARARRMRAAVEGRLGELAGPGGEDGS